MTPAAREFWRRVCLPSSHPDAAHLSIAEDDRIAQFRARGLNWSTIAHRLMLKRLGLKRASEARKRRA